MLKIFVKNEIGGIDINVTSVNCHEIENININEPTNIIKLRKKTLIFVETIAETVLQSDEKRERISPECALSKNPISCLTTEANKSLRIRLVTSIVVYEKMPPRKPPDIELKSANIPIKISV